MTCPATHPETGEPCTWPVDPHGTHRSGSGLMWEDAELVARVTATTRRPGTSGRRETKQRLTQMANAARPKQTGQIDDSEINGRWWDDEWLVYAGSAFDAFLLTRAQPFTTPEDFWPLVDRPREPRQFSRVVQASLRTRQIEEVGSKRLRGRYRTKDGYEFAINKLVPIYRSRIYRAP